MMAAIRHLLMSLLAVSSLAEVARTGPDEPRSAKGQEVAAARDLLHQAKRLLDEQYRAHPTAGFRYTDHVAAALAAVGDHDAAEATSHHRHDFGFTDAALHALAVGYARGGDLPRIRQTIARIQDTGPVESKQKPRAWLHVGQALARTGRKEGASEAFTEAINSLPRVSAYPFLIVDRSMEIAEGLSGIGCAEKSLAAFDLALSAALADPDRPMRKIALSRIAATQAKLGFLPQALATADRIEEPGDRWWAWFGIVDAEARAGHLNWA
jgi:hypothetical protein